MISDPVERFYYRLALEWGCSVESLKMKLGHDELIGWLAFEQLEPWGCRVQDDRFGVMTAAIMNFLTAVFGSSANQKNADDYFPARNHFEREEQVARRAFQFFDNFTPRQ